MKPCEEMHSAVEEVDVDPCDLYLDLGALIVEGRIPGLTDRGFGEGPHCPPTATGAYAQQSPQCRHHCNLEAPECQRYEQIKKHMLLLWKNGIPMSVEVLLYPNCCTAATPIQSDTSVMPDMPYVLLEQWTVHMLPRRVPDASIHPRGLLQAMRSYLHFSQLCAWFSLTGGKSPQNVHYRVCVPGEAFSSRFMVPPETHIFPIANVGRYAAMKVLLKSRPRSGEIPTVICSHHPDVLLASKYVKNDTKSKHLDKADTRTDGEILDGVLPTPSPSRTGSPADTMLGESLLDPPPSLCMYPKRYQSPSRCGSPSLEVPEHLMFGKGAKTKREAQRQRMNANMTNRSRSHRKPVTERVCDLNSTERPSKEKSYTNIDLNNCFCDDLSTVPKAEMEAVLHKLRNRRGTTKNDPHTLSKAEKFEYLNSNFEEDIREAKNSSKFPHKWEEPAKISSCYFKGPDETTHIQNHLYLKHIKNKFKKDDLFHLDSDINLRNVLDKNSRFYENRVQNSAPFIHKSIKKQQSNKVTSSENYTKTYQPLNNVSEQLSNSGVNIKKCGSLLEAVSLGDQLIDERDCSVLQKLKSNSSDDITDDTDDEYDPTNCTIPTAKDKAEFRRSFGSATSLVFHKKSGLPLTSSPAPIRKSGTCFDFDSTLTSVSAIKRALFEKDPEDADSERSQTLPTSISAPSSMTVSSLLGTFEESVLNGRLEPVSTVEGFTAEIGASGSFCPRHITLPVTIFFYTLQDIDKVTSPYLGHINLGRKDYHVPKSGTVQVTLFNPHRTVVKMFVVRYDLSDMPPNCQTFLRQRTLYMPTDAFESDSDAQKWLRYLIHLRFYSSKSGRIYLHTDIRMIIFRKSDLDAATVHGQRPYELRSFTQGPLNPKFSPHRP